MKTVLLMLSLILFSCENDSLADVVVQDETDVQLAIMTDYLNLTEDQATGFRGDVMELRKERKMKNGFHRGQKARMESFYDKLSSEQKSKLDDLKSQMAAGNLPEEYLDIRISKLSEFLDLSDDQSVKLKNFELDLHKKKVDLKSSEISTAEKKEQFENMRDQAQSELSSFLTSDQIEKYKQTNPKKKKMKQLKMRKERRFAKISSELDLTDAQIEQAKAIRSELRTSAKGIFQSDISREDKRNQMQELRASFETQFVDILTDDQKTKFAELKSKLEAMKQNRRDRRQK